jgi:tetratricopeptide (TPR) repeat protein
MGWLVAFAAPVLLAGCGVNTIPTDEEKAKAAWADVQAAPVGLAQSIAAAGITKGATMSGPAVALMKSTLKIMTWLKIKTAAKVATLAILVAGTATVAIHASDYIKRGRFYLFRGEYDHAIANFDQALQLDPQSAPAYFSRGRRLCPRGTRSARRSLPDRRPGTPPT